MAGTDGYGRGGRSGWAKVRGGSRTILAVVLLELWGWWSVLAGVEMMTAKVTVLRAAWVVDAPRCGVPGPTRQVTYRHQILMYPNTHVLPQATPTSHQLQHVNLAMATTSKESKHHNSRLYLCI